MFFSGALESYHNERLTYLPKRVHFPYDGMVLRGILAVLDHNANIGRECVGKSMKFSKSRKEWIIIKKYASKSTAWRDDLISKIMKLEDYFPNKKYDAEIPENIAPVPRPTLAEVERRPRYSRFSPM